MKQSILRSLICSPIAKTSFKAGIKSILLFIKLYYISYNLS